MPFYPFSESTTLGAVLREGLNDLRDARYKLAHIHGVMTAMSDAQVRDAFGFADSTIAGNAKSELLADISLLLANDAGTNTATQYAAILQMLNFFG